MLWFRVFFKSSRSRVSASRCGAPRPGGLEPLELAAPWRGCVRWIFLTPRPPPHSISVGSPGHYPSPCPGSAKCDPAPLIARGGRSAAGLVRLWLRRPPSQNGVHRPQAALRCGPCRWEGRDPAYLHTLLGAPRGACLLAESLPGQFSGTNSPVCSGASNRATHAHKPCPCSAL